MRRPTISDIAHECGISTTAVSFALNGRPGLSDARRAQVITVAHDMGWTPNAAARALSTSRVDAIGLVVTASFDALARDSFYLQLIAGIERTLAGTPTALVLKMVESMDEELAALRAWHGTRRVDAAILVNARVQDPRLELVEELGLPCVLVGATPGQAIPSVQVDDAETMRRLVADARHRGYGALAYLHPTSADSYRYAHDRLRALSDLDSAQGTGASRVESVDESLPAGAPGSVEAVIDAMVADGLPDLVLCDNEGLALSSLARLGEHGVRIPQDIGMVSWEDSSGLSLRKPSISSLDRDPRLLGAAAVDVLAALRDGESSPHRLIGPPQLVVRDSLPMRSRRTV